jgi:hypothetical protein
MRAYLLCLFPLIVGTHSQVFAQSDAVNENAVQLTQDDSTSAKPDSYSIKDTFLKSVKLNFLLRSSLEIPLGDDSQARVAQNEIRLESLADLTPHLSYRVRYRLNRSHAQKSLDNAPGSLDIAYVQYRFGNKLKWDLTVGKQAAMVGSWEFEKNPTFEYQYTDYVNQQLNLFLSAIRLGYRANPQHAFYLQLHNTFNDNFAVAHSNYAYSQNGLKASKMPLGIYAAWQGSLLENRLKTFWSYNISSFAQKKTNHSVSIANKIVIPRFEAYLDLHHSNIGVDYPNIVSPSVNDYRIRFNEASVPAFAQDVNYSAAILRIDYQFINRWYVTSKGFYESANLKNTSFGGKIRSNYGFLAGVEFKPVASQNMRLFSYYYHRQTAYKGEIGTVASNQNVNLLSFGVLYFVNVL